MTGPIMGALFPALKALVDDLAFFIHKWKRDRVMVSTSPIKRKRA